jgi:hypothetical protein
MPFIVYETTNLINGKKYRGVHKQDGEEFDGYLGSGDLIIRAIEKHGRENFSRTTMFVFEVEADAYKQEAAVVDEAWCRRGDTYNIKPGGIGGLPWDDPEFRLRHLNRLKELHANQDYREQQSTRARLAMTALNEDPHFRSQSSERMKARNSDPDVKMQLSASMKAMNDDPEFKSRLSARMKALQSRPDFKLRLSARMKAMQADPEQKARLSARMKALNDDPEFRARKSVSTKARHARRRLEKANTMLIIVD